MAADLHRHALGDPALTMVELALKAFLRSHGKTVSTGRDGHDIVTLHGRCQALGLPGDDPHGLENIFKLLATD